MDSSSFIEISELSDIPHSQSTNSKGRNNFGSSGGGGGGGVSFGGGIELLMNDRSKSSSSSSYGVKVSDDIDDLSKLEVELNELTNSEPSISMFDSFTSPSATSSSRSINTGASHSNSKSTMNIDLSSHSFDETPTINVNNTLGESTSDQSFSDNRTWDGYSKLNTTINPDKPYASPESTMSKEELLREKFKILKKIETLERKGVEFTKKYNMESSLSEMTGEYETVMDERSKQGSIKFQGNMMISLVNGLEYLNGKLDYLDIKLDGWSEQVNDNLNDYDDIFGELYDMYKDKASISPWVRLMFQLGGSAFMVHLTNTMFKSSMPNMDDIFRQNPDLMKSFQSAAVNTMGKSSPGFAGFMNGLGSGPSGSPPVSHNMSSSPSESYEDYVARSRGGNNTYGMSDHLPSSLPPPIAPNKSSIRQYPPQSQQTRPQNDTPVVESKGRPAPSSRPDMKGPADISDILSRLKPKQNTSPIPEYTPNIGNNQPPRTQDIPNISNQRSRPVGTSFGDNHEVITSINDTSTISLSELSDIQRDQTLPKRGRRKQKSDKNTISISL